MTKTNVFITSDNFMIVFYEDTWTDGFFTFGSDDCGPKITGDVFVAGTFCEIDELLDEDVERYRSIMSACAKELSLEN